MTSAMVLRCQVCSDTKTNGYHFGAFTCEGCKSFFGRNKHLRLEQIEACKNGGSCTINQETRATYRREILSALNQLQSHDSSLQATACQFTNDQLRRNNSSFENSVSIQQQSPVPNISIPSISIPSRNTSSVGSFQQNPSSNSYSSIQQLSTSLHLHQIFLYTRLFNAVKASSTNGLIGNGRNPSYDIENYLNQILPSISGESTNPQINLSREIVSETSVTEPSSQSAVNVIQTEPLNLSVHNERRMQRGQKRKRKVSENSTT
ncbi:nuclear hormone receptor family member nhr-34-like [Pseudomyrmex gracilis]|uniref:nuclear hormone receptor family member nhr-34-like n=1 Tax=Pseudomyrmex gracilis TaxID=219809 RepID=UPI0009954304|nr:nuclear hormone receptor family member nhr-34-like [Pseudomyrmex gracilis]